MLITASVALGLIGIVASGIAFRRCVVARPDRDPHAWWALGFVALAPAWLVAFVGLLSPVPNQPVSGPAAALWFLSAATGLAGAIASESVARAPASGVGARSSARCWCAGVLGLAPAWVLALAGHAIG